MSGPVYWITGLSNSGKSTLGQLLVTHLRQQGHSTVFLDGDELRLVYGDAGYSSDERKRTAFRNARLCQLLSHQGFTVVCSTISLFHEVQAWNRDHIPLYREIYLEASLEELQRRDTRGVYSAAHSVVGRDLHVELPVAPDLTLSVTQRTPSELLNDVLAKFEEPEDGLLR
jgi:adenylylsulfate kinase